MLTKWYGYLIPMTTFYKNLGVIFERFNNIGAKNIYHNFAEFGQNNFPQRSLFLYFSTQIQHMIARIASYNHVSTFILRKENGEEYIGFYYGYYEENDNQETDVKIQKFWNYHLEMLARDFDFISEDPIINVISEKWLQE